MKIHPRVTNNNSNKQIIFKSAYFEDFNPKYSSIKQLLEKETEKFILTGNNVTRLGEGIGGETYKFISPRLSNIVIKKNKPDYKEDYSKEYKNLSSIPTDIIGGQEAIARIKYANNHYLISSYVSGKTVSRSNPFTEKHLNSLFNKMFELDKLGIYHGDLNGKNILLESNGTVNFIDYQWTEKVENINFFDTTKSRKILQPLSEFPENAQMFEMALMPWYIDSLNTTTTKEQFLKSYLKAKARYHTKRYEYIKKNK